MSASRLCRIIQRLLAGLLLAGLLSGAQALELQRDPENPDRLWLRLDDAGDDTRLFLQPGGPRLQPLDSPPRRSAPARIKLPHRYRPASPVRQRARSPFGLLLADQHGKLTQITRSGDWLASVALGEPLRELVSDTGRALALTESGDLLLIDISRERLRIAARIPVGQQLHDWQLQGKQAFGHSGKRWYELDFSQPAPRISNRDLDAGEGVNFGGQRRAFIDGDRLFVADWFSGLHIYDISQPQRPRLLSGLHTPGSGKGIWLRDGIGYIGDDDHGLHVADLRVPERPHSLGAVPTNGLAYTPLPVGDHYLYLADHRGGLVIFDISQPTEPRPLAEYDTPGKVWSLAVEDRLAVLADDRAGLALLDISDPAKPVELSRFAPGAQFEEVLLHHGLAYAASFDDGLYVLDLQDPTQPRQLAHLPLPGNARGLERVGRHLYVAGWRAGLLVVDIANPRQPKLIGQLDTDGATWGVRIQHDTAYLLDWWNGLGVVDITDPARPRWLGGYLQDTPVAALDSFVASNGKPYLLSASGDRGLQVFDLQNPMNPTWAGGRELDGPARLITQLNGRAYLATDNARLYEVALDNPFDPQVRHVWQLASPASRLWTTGNRLQMQLQNGQRCGLTANAGSRPQCHVEPGDEPPQAALQLQVADRLAHMPKAVVRIGEQQVAALLEDRVQLLTVIGGRLTPTQTWPVPLDASGLHARGNTLYLAGPARIVALQIWPQLEFTRTTGQRFELTLPPDLPAGHWDLLRVEPGQWQLQANAVEKQAPRFSRPKLSPAQFQQLYRQKRQLK